MAFLWTCTCHREYTEHIFLLSPCEGVFLFHFSWQDSTRVSSCLYPCYACFVTGLQSPSQNTRQKCQTLTPNSFWETTDKEGSPGLGWKWTDSVCKLPRKLLKTWWLQGTQGNGSTKGRCRGTQRIDRKRNGGASKGARFYKAWPSFMRNK